MSKLEVNAIEPQSGTTLTVGASGDTIVIPSGATISNQGTAAGFGPTGAVSWNTTKITANPNPAVSGVGYFADTTSAAFTITLPSSPAAGAVIGIADYANTFATNNLTVARNGSNIGGSAINAVLSTNGVSVTFVYVDATQGWIVTDSGNRSDLPLPTYISATGGCVSTSGDYKIHTFTGPGTFTVTSVGNPAGSTTVDYLVVAGGGSGGMGNQAGGAGGGAGGLRISSGTASGSYTVSPLGSGVSAIPVSVQGYPITVGGGGASRSTPAPTRAGNSGNPSIFSTITSAGGGAGSGHTNTGSTGGSGGGGTGGGPTAPETGKNGNTPPVAPSQGNNGGTGGTDASNVASGGGGGAGSVGGTISNPSNPGGPGGDGIQTNINGTLYYFSGGGGGSSWVVPGTTGGNGGLGGGGGGYSPVSSGTGGPGLNNGAAGGPAPGPGDGGAGGANTGGGGGGGNDKPGSSGAGGSGIVILRYKFQ